jgi:hypothetical protein
MYEYVRTTVASCFGIKEIVIGFTLPSWNCANMSIYSLHKAGISSIKVVQFCYKHYKYFLFVTTTFLYMTVYSDIIKR